ncbi:MAG: ABC transporter permease [Candidatus Firestonebacteria bacterium]|nr:ABC transporter permease [Candidatus Firestonebacteria bacterium]
MVRYLFRRLLLSIPILFGITLVTFAIVHLTPGGFSAVQREMNPKISPDSLAQLQALYGLNQPWPKQYSQWVGRLVRLDFGRSFLDQRPVLDKIADRLPATLLLSGLSLLVIFLLAIPLGVFSAMRPNSAMDHTITVVTFIGYSLPTFWLALLLMLLFGVVLNWLPISGLRSVNHDFLPFWDKLKDYAAHLILPVFISAFGGIASISRYTRGNMLEVVRQDYIRTALAKGLPTKRVYYVHALRNALLPILTILGLSLPGLIGGSFIFETIFAWPGMGRLAYESALSFDYPTIMGIAVIGALLTLLGNLLADLLYAWADPRIRL